MSAGGNDGPRSDVGCDAFAGDAGELATGSLDDARSRALLSHTATCPTCRSLLDEIVAVVDQLLLLAPSAEPPAGFEAGAVAALQRDAPEPRRRRRPVTWVAAAAAVFFAGAALGGWIADDDGDRDGTQRTAVIAAVAADGDVERAGSVELDGGRLVVRLGTRPAWPAEVTCELRARDGEWVPVATWRPHPQRGGVWALDVEGGLAGAGEMRLVGAGGEVVGQAFLT